MWLGLASPGGDWRRRALRCGALGAAALAVVLPSSCRRFKTTDELRAELRAPSDSTFMRHPCQSLTVDEFGWTLDSLDGVAFRLHPSMQRYGRKTFRDVTYRSRNARNWIRLELPVGYTDIYPYAQRLSRYRREDCAIRERTATVVVGLRGFDYQTTVIWSDIGDGRQLIATATGRTMEELQLLRGTLFTMRFP